MARRWQGNGVISRVVHWHENKKWHTAKHKHKHNHQQAELYIPAERDSAEDLRRVLWNVQTKPRQSEMTRPKPAAFKKWMCDKLNKKVSLELKRSCIFKQPCQYFHFDVNEWKGCRTLSTKLASLTWLQNNIFSSTCPQKLERSRSLFPFLVCNRFYS